MACEVILLDGDNDSDLYNSSRKEEETTEKRNRRVQVHNSFSLLSSDSDQESKLNDNGNGEKRAGVTGDDHQDDFLCLFGIPKEKPRLVSDIEAPVQNSSGVNNNIPSDIICLDDDDDGITEFPDKNVENLSFAAFPTSSPNINREMDVSIIISDDEQINPTITNTSTKRANISSSIMSDISSIIMNEPPLPYPISENRRRSSSIGSITAPKTKPKRVKRTATDTSIHNNLSNINFNIKRNGDRTATTSTLSTKNSRTNTNDVFNTPIRYPSSVISDFSDSFSEIDTSQLDDNPMQRLKLMKKKQSSTVKNLISDLQKERQNKEIVTGSKYSKHVNKTMEKSSNSDNANKEQKKDDDKDVYDTTISNSSVELQPCTRFIDVVTDDIDLYSEERLELLYERSRDIEPQKLRKINQVKYSKDELTERMTCLFSCKIDEQLKEINNKYSSFIELTKFEVFEDVLLPIIKFSRLTDSIYYKKRSTFVPIKPRQIEEKFVILLYDAKDLIKLFKEKIMKRHIKSVKLKYKDYKISIWILGYDQYMQNLKTKYTKLHAKAAQEKLNKDIPNNDNEPIKRKRKVTKEPEESLDDLILPSNIHDKILKYEIEHELTFQMFKGLKDMLDWLKSYAYTLSCKHIDILERNEDLSNIGKVKSKEDPAECGIEMLTHFRNMNEDRAKKVFKERGYKNIGEFYKDIKNGFDFVDERLLRNDQQNLLRKLFRSMNENEILM